LDVLIIAEPPACAGPERCSPCPTCPPRKELHAGHGDMGWSSARV